MGKVWLETSEGRLIHLTIVEDDFNTPNDPVKIPTSIIGIQNRCYGEQIQIVHPTLGSFTINLKPEGVTGSCNQCGMCCGHPVADCPWGSLEQCGYILHEDLQWHVCQHLVIDRWRKWGDPDNSYCELYATILDNFKGCAYPPLHHHPWMTGCGYTFS